MLKSQITTSRTVFPRGMRPCARKSMVENALTFSNTFFVQALFDAKSNDPGKIGVYNYEKVRRWSSNVPGKDIFNLKYIICPVNEGNIHWTLAVIFMEEKRIQWYNSTGGTDHKI